MYILTENLARAFLRWKSGFELHIISAFPATSRKKNRATFPPRVPTYLFSMNEAGVIIAEERHAGLDGYGCISDYLRISISGLAFVHNLTWTAFFLPLKTTAISLSFQWLCWLANNTTASTAIFLYPPLPNFQLRRRLYTD